ncbi:MAG: hypothetical protein M3R70_01340 [Actinomycetota bacterium]|nr:hypothetical protein [Actinomycetota bacterium]
MLAAVTMAALGVGGGAQALGSSEPSLLSGLRAGNGGTPFAGDGSLLTTVSPNGDGFRDAAVFRFRLARAARVFVQVFKPTDRASFPQLVAWQSRALAAGWRRLAWRPPRTFQPRSYLVRLTAIDRSGRRQIIGRLRRGDRAVQPGPVVQVSEIEAGFKRASYAPGANAHLVVSTDSESLTLEFFQAGPETEPSLYHGYHQDELFGVPVGEPIHVDWSAHRSRPGVVNLRIPNGPSGLYFVRVTGDDGRLGFAPFVRLPQGLGRHRVAVVIPTNTWAAYNHRDMNGDGWGDTWYANESFNRVDLTRPNLHRGVPMRLRAYALGFIRWLYVTNKQVDFFSDAELDQVSGRRLSASYDLIVFVGHHEYMTTHAYNAVAHYRDLGGNLMFTATTNFLWRIQRHGHWIIRKKEWRDSRPEAGLIGVQYLHNDGGVHQGHYLVTGADRAPWAFKGTGLRNGSSFGHGGIEIDARTSASPPGTIVLASMPNLHGPGLSAEMTYYTTRSGAKVFAAGTLNFAGTATEPDVSAVLENVWSHLARP